MTQFDRSLEAGAAAAWGAMLLEKAREYDLERVPTEEMERLAAIAWDLGLTFAEGRPAQLPITVEAHPDGR